MIMKTRLEYSILATFLIIQKIYLQKNIQSALELLRNLSEFVWF